MRRVLIILTILVAQAIPAVAQSREKDLDRWVDQDLIPYVRQQLIMHPRFKNETVMFVVLRDNAPASASNALALSMRDRLLAAAVATPGVEIGWQQGRSSASLETQPQDCSNDDVHYYIGIELTQKLDSSYAVSVRALDLEDRNWVSGFGKRWQGQLSTSQRQAMRQDRVDETFLGARDVPFTLNQTDLLAAHLAHQLSCTLQRRVEDDYVVTTRLLEPPAAGLDGTLELISNNLANRQALRLAVEEDTTNAVLSGKAHRIDGNLFQYWLTVTPTNGHDDIAALSASAYIILPDAAPATTATVAVSTPTSPAKAPPVTIPNGGKDALLSPLRVARPASLADCGAQGPCSLLQTEPREDLVVFFLEHQARHGLVRLAGSDCRRRTSARIARSGQPLAFPIERTTTNSANWTEVYDWKINPDLDTFYAVAVADAGLARRLANLFDELPRRCGDAMRPGLQDDDLQAWLGNFAMLTAHASQYVDWRAIEVREIY